MYATNLAIVFGPTIMRPPPGPSNFSQAMANLGQHQNVVKNLILQYHWLFDVEEEGDAAEEGGAVGGEEAEREEEVEEEERIRVQEEAEAGFAQSVETITTSLGRQASEDREGEAEETEEEEIPLSSTSTASSHPSPLMGLSKHGGGNRSGGWFEEGSQ